MASGAAWACEKADEELVCEDCGSQMEEIGKEVHRTLKMEQPKFWIREDVYYTYACKNCEQETGEANILKTPKEPALLPGSFASAEAVAHIMTQKFVMYSPLYRLEQEFNRQGLKLSRQTMSNWLLNVSEMWLQPRVGSIILYICPIFPCVAPLCKVLHYSKTGVPWQIKYGAYTLLHSSPCIIPYPPLPAQGHF